MKHAYTSADVDIPIKILHDTELVTQIVTHKHIPLRHLQLCLTNKCQLDCQFCSCGDRDRKTEMPLLEAANLLRTVKELGCRGITITGGGEPLLYPHINEVITQCFNLGIKVGLVTNGIAIDKLEVSPSWLRVSFDSHRPWRGINTKLNKAMKKHPETDWAISFVAHEGLGELKKVVRFANANKMTHVRVVSDILDPKDDIINEAKRALKDNDSRVIYQYRSNPTKGRQRCLISLLKPTVGADGTIYPCCGAQYALPEPLTKDFPSRMAMGKDLKSIIIQQHYFDGSVCDRCYYDNYNKLLGYMVEDVKHKEWI